MEVTPVLPAALARLPQLAANLFFSWHRPTRALFEDLDRQLWEQTGGNPRLMLRCLEQERLNHAAADPVYLARYAEVLSTFDEYLRAEAPGSGAPVIAYFCAEYGFHESFPIYSGGLGVLAGDYIKGASDQRRSFVGVGLLYGQGYFTQSLDSDGVQHAEYSEQDPRDLPVEAVLESAGKPLTVSVRIAGRDVVARLWRAQVGRVPVYLLDTNCPENAPSDRDITHRLYGGDESTRIRQEMVLGIGGRRALTALGLQPAVWHLNEGHAAFLILELLRESVARGLTLAAALEVVAAQCVFTTHTPVAAGHDAFNHDLMMAHFGDFIRELGLPIERVLELGRAPSAPGQFNMTRLALNGSRRLNGVSRIHGLVSARLCADQWPEIRPQDNPVGYVTNGVHIETFLHQSWQEFFEQRLSADWRNHLLDPPFWRSVEQIPDEDYWSLAQSVKARMLSGVRERLQHDYARKGLSPSVWRHVTRHLDPNDPSTLIVGFARRFATYKRAALLLRDRQRLARVVNQPGRQVLFLFAGKAHPADEPGKHVLREIQQLMLVPEFMGRVVFLEDYDMQLARWLVSGVDVWLNHPVAPLEASGTSGMKAAVNGVPHCSIGDGWWAEGYNGANGWLIDGRANPEDYGASDASDADALYRLLEEQIVPAFYDRDENDIPHRWLRIVKETIRTVTPYFSTRRMLKEYVEQMYLPLLLESKAEV